MKTSVGVRKRTLHPCSRLLGCLPTSRSLLMVSVGMTVLRLTDLHFLDAGVKISGQ